MCQLCAESIITRAGEARPGTVKSGDPAGVEGVLTYLGASRRYNGIVASLGGPRPRGHHLASEAKQNSCGGGRRGASKSRGS
eukprot:s2808_g3.t2